MRVFVYAILMCILGAPAFGLDQPDNYFEYLRQVNTDFRVNGAVSEEVARLHLRARFPEHRYDIYRGVSIYVNPFDRESHRTGAELDIVVVHKATGSVVLIAEVKASSSPSQVSKASKQLNNFVHLLQGNSITKIVHPPSGSKFTPEQFQGSWRFEIVGALDEKGENNACFDWTIDLKKSEILALKARLVAEEDRLSKLSQTMKIPLEKLQEKKIHHPHMNIAFPSCAQSFLEN